MTKQTEEWKPTLKFQFPDGVTLIGDFDTGAPISFISYEWLVSSSLIKPISAFVKAGRHTGSGTLYYSALPLDLDATR